MKITICGSSSFRAEKVKAMADLKKMGHIPLLDTDCIDIAAGRNPELAKRVATETAKTKREKDYIRMYYEMIKNSDAILIVNPEKNGIKNYIGANSFLEIGYAHALNKKIYILYDLPEQNYIYDELYAIEITVLNGDFGKIDNLFVDN